MVRISIDEILASLPVLDEVPRSGCGSCGSGEGESRCGNGLEKVYPTTAVRFGYMKHIGEFSHAPNMKFTCGAKVVIQTSRGLEIGEQVSLTCNGCSKSVSRDQVKAYAEASGENTFIFDAGRIIREANRADLAEHARIQSVVPAHRDLCRRLAREHGLPIKVVECELLFGGERAIFYFSSEGRIDFRDLVRDLSAELQTRIQMIQVGARDEARLLADFETCGRECCCKVFLKTLKPVTMKMAKMQKQTIDPSKVSGRCGRLKCCLRYEHESYEELARKLPRVGAHIRTAHGDGVVVNRQILTQLVQIQTADERLVTVVVEDILTGPSGQAGEGVAGRLSGIRRDQAMPRMAAGETAGPEEIQPPALHEEEDGLIPEDAGREEPPAPESSTPPPGSSEGGRENGPRSGHRPRRRRIVGRQVGSGPPKSPPDVGAGPPKPQTPGPGHRSVRRFRPRRRDGGGPPSGPRTSGPPEGPAPGGGA